jgi:hypothetical protein
MVQITAEKRARVVRTGSKLQSLLKYFIRER